MLEFAQLPPLQCRFFHKFCPMRIQPYKLGQFTGKYFSDFKQLLIFEFYFYMVLY